MNRLDSIVLVEIQDFTVPLPIPETYEEDCWVSLRQALEDISAGKVPPNLNNLYKQVKNLCFYGYAEGLRTRLGQELQSMARLELERIRLFDSDWVRNLDQWWSDYRYKFGLVQHIFLHLDQIHHGNAQPIWELALHSLRAVLLTNPHVCNKIIQAGIGWIDHMRNNGLETDTLAENMISMFESLKLLNQFGDELIIQSRQFYRLVGDQVFGLDNVSTSLSTVESAISQEAVRCQMFKPNLQKDILDIVNKELVSRHLGVILGRGLHGFLENNDKSNVSRVRKLIEPIDGIPALISDFCRYIKERGTEILKIQSISGLIVFTSRMNTLTVECFDGLEPVQNALRSSLEWVVNSDSDSPHALAQHIDMMLTQSKAGSQIDQALALFRLVHKKDEFEQTHRQNLAKRLLSRTLKSMHAETAILNGMKQECGADFVDKLEGMISDINLSENVQAAFRHINSKDGLGVNIRILNSTTWPIEPTQTNLVVPPCMQQYQTRFLNFYSEKYPGKRLMWDYSKGNCIMKAHFPKGDKELDVTVHQAAVLELFSHVSCLSVQQIRHRTSMSNPEIEATLESLVRSQYKVLIHNSTSTEISESDTVEVNLDFETPLHRLQLEEPILQALSQDPPARRKQTSQDIQHRLDSAIVRLFKSKKTLTFSRLVSELFAILPFSVLHEDISKRLNSLADRDFVRIIGDNPLVYQYVP